MCCIRIFTRNIWFLPFYGLLLLDVCALLVRPLLVNDYHWRGLKFLICRLTFFIKFSSYASLTLDESQKFIRCSHEIHANRYQLYLGREDLVSNWRSCPLTSPHTINLSSSPCTIRRWKSCHTKDWQIPPTVCGCHPQVMDCMLAGSEVTSVQQYLNQLQLYAAAGLRPKIEIYNSTNSLSFTFNLNMVSKIYIILCESQLYCGCAMILSLWTSV